MQREIGSWRRRESSGRFAGARLRKERICPILSTHNRGRCQGRVLGVRKCCAVREDLCSKTRSHHRAFQGNFTTDQPIFEQGASHAPGPRSTHFQLCNVQRRPASLQARSCLL